MTQLKSLSGTFTFAPQSGHGPDLGTQFAALCDALSRNYRFPTLETAARDAGEDASPESDAVRFPVVLTFAERRGENFLGTVEKKLREWFIIALAAARGVPGTIGDAARFVETVIDVVSSDTNARAAAAEVKRGAAAEPSVALLARSNEMLANLRTQGLQDLPAFAAEHWKSFWDWLHEFEKKDPAAGNVVVDAGAKPLPPVVGFDVTQFFGWMAAKPDRKDRYAFTLEGRTRNPDDAIEYGEWARLDILGPDGAQLLTHYVDKVQLRTWLWTAGDVGSVVFAQNSELRVALLGAHSAQVAKRLTTVRGRLWFSGGEACEARTFAVYIPPQTSHIVDCCRAPFELESCGESTQEFMVAPTALAVAQTDSNGYFEFDYPAEMEIKARYALFHVVGLRMPVSLKLETGDLGNRFPTRTLLEIDSRLIAPRSEPIAWVDGEDSECSCNGVIEFDTPDRAVDEFKFDVVVRTTDPMIVEVDDGDLTDGNVGHGGGLPSEDGINRCFRKSLSRAEQMAWDKPHRVARAVTISHGRILSIVQSWHTDGHSLGDLRYSLPLAPLQKKNIAIIDWDRQDLLRMEAQQENRESLSNLIGRQRDVSEIANAAFNETINSHSDSHSSSGSAGGGFGFIGVFGSASGGSANSSSNASQSANRNMASSLLNQLRDQTVQSANSFRSQRITTVQQVNQSESARAVTETVANRNACHAITVQYFEVLRHFKVEHELVSVRECLFIPLPLARFDDAKILRWRAAVERYLLDGTQRQGLTAVERRVAAHANPEVYGGGATYADEAIRSVGGALRLRLDFPMPSAALDPKWDPKSFEIEFGSSAPIMSMLTRFAHQPPDARPDFWEAQVAPAVARQYVRELALLVKGSGVTLPLEASLTSAFVNGEEHYVTLSQTRDFADIPAIARKSMLAVDIKSCKINGAYTAALTSAEFHIEVDGLSITTQPAAGARGSLGTGSLLTVETPLSVREARNRQEDDRLLADRLLTHVNDNLEYYHKALWWTMDPDRRYSLLDGYIAPNSGGRSVASVVENRLVGIIGNSLVMPVASGIRLDYFADSGNADRGAPVEDPLLAYYRPTIPLEPTRICVPTKGVFAEAVMGKCNACEKVDNSRNWQYWQHALPDQPTEIQPVSLDSRTQNVPPATAPGMAPAVVTQVATSLPPAPEPGAALANVLTAITRSGVFPDLTGLQGTQQNTREALQGSFDTTRRFGELGAELSKQQLNAAMDAMKLIATLYTGIPLPMSGGGSDAAESPSVVRQSIQSDAKAGRISPQQAQDALDRLNHVMIDKAESNDNKQLLDHPEVSAAIQTAAQRGARLSISHQGSSIDVGENSSTPQAAERPRRSLWARLFSPTEAQAAEPAVDASADAQRIVDRCRQEFKANQYDCNHFVKAVTAPFFNEAPFGKDLDADGIIGAMRRDPRWVSLDDDPQKAIAAANAGKMVIAGMTADEYHDTNGHVAVVVDVNDPKARSGSKIPTKDLPVPMCYAGSNSTRDPGVRVHPGRISRTFSSTFARERKIHYFARKLER